MERTYVNLEYSSTAPIRIVIILSKCLKLPTKFKIFQTRRGRDFAGACSTEINCQIKILFFISVCKATIDEMLAAIAKVDPKKRADVGGYRMDSEGKSVTRTVQYSRSETYLTELMENICMY